MVSYKFHSIGLLLLVLSNFGHTYVLLTANIEDVKKLAREFVSVPVADLIAKFIAKVTGNTSVKNVSDENEENDLEVQNVSNDLDQFDKEARQSGSSKSYGNRHIKTTADNGEDISEPTLYEKGREASIYDDVVKPKPNIEDFEQRIVNVQKKLRENSFERDKDDETYSPNKVGLLDWVSPQISLKPGLWKKTTKFGTRDVEPNDWDSKMKYIINIQSDIKEKSQEEEYAKEFFKRRPKYIEAPKPFQTQRPTLPRQLNYKMENTIKPKQRYPIEPRQIWKNPSTPDTNYQSKYKQNMNINQETKQNRVIKRIKKSKYIREHQDQSRMERREKYKIRQKPQHSEENIADTVDNGKYPEDIKHEDAMPGETYQNELGPNTEYEKKRQMPVIINDDQQAQASTMGAVESDENMSDRQNLRQKLRNKKRPALISNDRERNSPNIGTEIDTKFFDTSKPTKLFKFKSRYNDNSQFKARANLSTKKEKNEFDQYDLPKLLATSGPVLLPKLSAEMR